MLCWLPSNLIKHNDLAFSAGVFPSIRTIIPFPGWDKRQIVFMICTWTDLKSVLTILQTFDQSDAWGHFQAIWSGVGEPLSNFKYRISVKPQDMILINILFSTGVLCKMPSVCWTLVRLVTLKKHLSNNRYQSALLCICFSFTPLPSSMLLWAYYSCTIPVK